LGRLLLVGTLLMDGADGGISDARSGGGAAGGGLGSAGGVKGAGSDSGVAGRNPR
jgi:hypothetical protein